MSDRRLQVFHAVAKHGSFTRAAEHLHMTQPAVTFQIKQLEDHLNARLLERGHGKISLTSTGELVLAYAEQILDLSEELDSRVAELAGELAGKLDIGSIPAIAGYWLPPILERFKRKYPRVLPRVVMGNSRHIEEGVAAREIDIGFIEAATDNPAVEPRVATQEELVVICSPDHPLASHKQLTAHDLAAHPFIDRGTAGATATRRTRSHTRPVSQLILCKMRSCCVFTVAPHVQYMSGSCHCKAGSAPDPASANQATNRNGVPDCCSASRLSRSKNSPAPLVSCQAKPSNR